MNREEFAMYTILKNNRKARHSNWEAVRMFFKAMYGVNLPEITEDLPSVWTVERMIRTLKATYPKALTDSEERQIKKQKEAEFKERALDKNRPVLTEQLGIGLLGGDNYKG